MLTCGVCTADNPFTADLCQVCGQPLVVTRVSGLPTPAATPVHPTESKVAVVQASTKACISCTFDNAPEMIECEMCGALLLLPTRETAPRPALRTALLTRLLRATAQEEKPLPRPSRPMSAQAAKVQFQEMLAFCRSTRTHYQDPDFPATAQSLFGAFTRNFPDLLWLRLDMMKKHYDGPSLDHDTMCNHPYRCLENELRASAQASPWTVLDGIAHAQQLQQGTLGDCWLLSALSVCTERPEIIDNLLVTKLVNSEGIYQVRLCHDGIWQIVVVDDFFPALNDDRFAYGHASGGMIWVSLVEKAYAKLHGSYAAIIGGNPREAFLSLTGAPITTLRFHKHGLDPAPEPDTVWARIASAQDSKYLLAASSIAQDEADDTFSPDTFNVMGLKYAHCYAILDAKHLSSQHRFVKVRNPWGRDNGAGCRGSAHLFTPDVRNVLGVKNEAEDGIFWLAFADLLRYFSRAVICMYDSTWESSRQQHVFDKDTVNPLPDTYLCITSQTRMRVHVNLIQPTTRGSRGHALTGRCHNLPCLDLGCVITRQPHFKTVHALQFVDAMISMAAADNEISFALSEPDCAYFVFPMSVRALAYVHQEEKSSSQKQFTVVSNVYSPKRCEIMSLAVTGNEDLYTTYVASMHLLCLHKGSKKALTENITVYRYLNDCSCWLLVENKSLLFQQVTVTVTATVGFNVTAARNADAASNFQSFVTVDAVAPNHRQIVNLVSNNENAPWGLRWSATSNTNISTARPHSPALSDQGLRLHRVFPVL